MATIVANPYYDDPFLASIASNISRAFIDRNPGQTAAGRAQARLYGLKADEIESQRTGRQTLSQLFSKPMGPNGTYTPEQVQQMTAAGIGAGIDPKDPSQYFLFNAANSGQPTENVVRARSGAGLALGKDQAVTQEQQREIIARDENTRRQVASIGAGPGYARVAEDTRHNKATEDFRERTRWDKPVEVSRDAAIYGLPEDPRLKGVAPGTVPAPGPDKKIAGYDSNGQPVYIDANTAAGKRRPPTAAEASQTKPPRPGDINSPKDVSEAEWNILSKIGAVTSDGKVDPAFIAEYGDRMPGALAAIGAPGNNAGSAESIYLKALGIEPGSTWGATNWLGWGGKKLNPPPKKASPVVGAVTGDGTPAPAAAAPGPRAAPQQSVMPPPANPAERKAGTVYTTPKGLMTWTGTGWVPAGSQ